VRGRWRSGSRRFKPGDVDRDLLDVSPADRRFAALVAVGSNHFARSIQQHRARLLHRASARDDRRPFSQLGHRPTVLIGSEDRGQRQRIAHTFNG
jgi:hypothetical protein